ncbi:DEAD/DEAH box helicase [Treponema sp. OMZ 840]|uniref:DNA repair helicase XPB n=1 Tax=Treponema sp. OMZ 840 TaxID=244313 RepID=UPI003D8CDAB1
MQNSAPLIVQGDRTLLLDVHAPLAEECRRALIPFAELERSPEHLHTYRLSSLSLWNAAGAGLFADYALSVLKKYSRFDVPQSISAWIYETASRFGKIRLIPDAGTEESLLLQTDSIAVFRELEANKKLSKYLTDSGEKLCFRLSFTDRGTIKEELLKTGWPVKDEVPLKDGDTLDINIREKTLSGSDFIIRAYQKNAAEAFLGDCRPGTGFGTIVLPCGSGKTIVGILLMAKLRTNTLIVTANISSIHQWITELTDKTDLPADQIGEYSGEKKEIRPVTVATYQVLTWRPEKEGPYPHFKLFRDRNWGLIIYDEVHLLPAPVFRVTAELQAVRRAGLTATLVREDGCEGLVFSLVGPKRYDVPWKELETSGWIANAVCIEFRTDLDKSKELEYAVASLRQKHRIAGENPLKVPLVLDLVKRFGDDKILIIGQYLNQLFEIANLLKVPIITGKTPVRERDTIYDDFRSGKERILVVSKVANFAIDLPDASMAIQVSGTFGSRQEEAQRLGRILRPKNRTARFITLITAGTQEEDYGANRQKFLAEQGYSYRLVRTIEECLDTCPEDGSGGGQ